MGRSFVFFSSVEVLKYEVQEEDQDWKFPGSKTLAKTKNQITKIRSDEPRIWGKRGRIFTPTSWFLKTAVSDDALFRKSENRRQRRAVPSPRYLRYIDGFSRLEDEYLRNARHEGHFRVSWKFVGLPGQLWTNRDSRIEDLSPSDTASLDEGKILGIATDAGTNQICRDHGSIERCSRRRRSEADDGATFDGDSVLIDGFEGMLSTQRKPLFSVMARLG